MVSYLTLAAVDHAHLLVRSLPAIIDAICQQAHRKQQQQQQLQSSQQQGGSNSSNDCSVKGGRGGGEADEGEEDSLLKLLHRLYEFDPNGAATHAALPRLTPLLLTGGAFLRVGDNEATLLRLFLLVAAATPHLLLPHADALCAK